MIKGNPVMLIPGTKFKVQTSSKKIAFILFYF